MGNNAIQVNDDAVNGSHAHIAITTHGSDWYWAVCAVMTVATFSFIGLSITVPRERRVFHYITAAVTMVAAIAYFSMASNLGWVGIDVEYRRNGGGVGGQAREIFYVRYIDWFITTPLLLMDLLLTAAMPWPTIIFVVIVDEMMIVTGLVGALVSSGYKWGYFVFGCVGLLYIFYVLVWEARRNSAAIGKDVGKVFMICGSLTALLWWLYPIAWGVCEGGNVITADSEAVFYGILDVLAKPVFGALLIWGHRGIDPARLGLNIHDYANDHVVRTGEKGTNGTTDTNGVSNGHTNSATETV